MKIKEKVSFNIASEASYAYNTGDKSWLEMPKMVNFDELLKTWNLQWNSVTRQVNYYRTKIDEKHQS